MMISFYVVARRAPALSDEATSILKQEIASGKNKSALATT